MDCYGGQQSDDKQWGYCESTSTVQKHSFVLPFAKECWHCSVIPWKTPSSGYCSVAYTVSKAEFESYYYQATRTVSNCYIAIGVQQWGNTEQNTVTLPIAYTKYYCVAISTSWGYAAVRIENLAKLTFVDAHSAQNFRYITIGV